VGCHQRAWAGCPWAAWLAAGLLALLSTRVAYLALARWLLRACWVGLAALARALGRARCSGPLSSTPPPRRAPLAGAAVRHRKPRPARALVPPRALAKRARACAAPRNLLHTNKGEKQEELRILKSKLLHQIKTIRNETLGPQCEL